MKFRIEQSEITKLLSFVQKAVILSGEIKNRCIFLSAENNILSARAASNERIIKGQVAAGVDTSGSCCVEGKLLFEAVAHLEAGSVTFELIENQLHISIGNTQITLNTIKVDVFSDITEKEISFSANIQASDLQKVIKQVVNIASKDNTRPILTGLFFEIDEQTLALTASDSYRLAYAQTKLTKPNKTAFNFVIKADIFSDISSLLTSENILDIKVSNNQIILVIENYTIAVNQIEGKFPDFRAMLPNSFTTQLQFNKNELLAALKQIVQVGKNNSAVKLSIDPDVSALELFVKTQDVGEASSKIQAQIKGEARQLNYNYSFLKEGIEAAETDDVYLEILADNKPGLIKNITGDDYLYLLMPIRS